MLPYFMVRSQEEVEILDLSSIEMIYGSSSFKGLATGGNVSPAMAMIGERACFYSIACVGNQLLFVGRRSVHVLAVRTWTERIDHLVANRHPKEAIALAMSFYQEKGKAVVGLSGSKKKRKESVAKKLLSLILSVLEDENFSNSSSSNSLAQKTLSHMQYCKDLVGLAVEYLIILGRSDVLFGSAWDLISPFQVAKDAYLEALEPFVLNEEFVDIPPQIVQEYVDHFERHRNFQALEASLVHLPISSLDLHQVLKLCRKHSLYEAILSIHARGMKDYLGPLEELLLTLKEALDNGEPLSNDLIVLGNKLLVYVSCCLSGLAYPVGVIPSEEERRQVKYEVFTCLTTLHSPNAPDEERAYPFLRTFLRFDTQAFLNVLSLAFEEPEFSSSESGLQRKQRTVDVLIKIILNGENADSTSIQMGYLSMFLARQLSLPPPTIVVSRDVLQKMIAHLCDSSSGDHTSREEGLLMLVNSRVDLGDQSVLLRMAEKAKFYRLCESLYMERGEYEQVLRCYIVDPRRRDQSFSLVRKELLRGERYHQTTHVVRKHFPDLVEIDTEKSARLALDFFAPILHDLLATLSDSADLEFKFLDAVVTTWPTVASASTSSVISSGPLSPYPPSDISAKYVRLLCHKNPSAVTPYLKSYEGYPLDHVLELPSADSDLFFSQLESQLLLCIGLAQRSSPALSAKEKWDMWFPILEALLKPQHARNLSPRDMEGLRESTKFVITSMLGYVSLPAILSRVMKDPVYCKGQFGEVKDLIIGMISCYSYEETLLESTARLLRSEAGLSLAELSAVSQKGFSVPRDRCRICRKEIKKVGIVFSCGDCFHVPCLDAALPLPATGEGSSENGGVEPYCPMCRQQGHPARKFRPINRPPSKKVRRGSTTVMGNTVADEDDEVSTANLEVYLSRIRDLNPSISPLSVLSSLSGDAETKGLSDHVKQESVGLPELHTAAPAMGLLWISAFSPTNPYPRHGRRRAKLHTSPPAIQTSEDPEDTYLTLLHLVEESNDSFPASGTPPLPQEESLRTFKMENHPAEFHEESSVNSSALESTVTPSQPVSPIELKKQESSVASSQPNSSIALKTQETTVNLSQPSSSTALEKSESTVAYQSNSSLALEKQESSVAPSQPNPSTASEKQESTVAPSQPNPSTASEKQESTVAPSQPNSSTTSKKQESTVAPSQPNPSTASEKQESTVAPSQPNPSTASKKQESTVAPSQPNPSTASEKQESMLDLSKPDSLDEFKEGGSVTVSLINQATVNIDAANEAGGGFGGGPGGGAVSRNNATIQNTNDDIVRNTGINSNPVTLNLEVAADDIVETSHKGFLDYFGFGRQLEDHVPLDSLDVPLLLILARSLGTDSSNYVQDLPAVFQELFTTTAAIDLLIDIDEIRNSMMQAVAIMREDVQSSLPKDLLISIRKEFSPSYLSRVATDFRRAFEKRLRQNIDIVSKKTGFSSSDSDGLLRQTTVTLDDLVELVPILTLVNNSPTVTATVPNAGTGGRRGGGGEGADSRNTVRRTNQNNDDIRNNFNNNNPVEINVNVSGTVTESDDTKRIFGRSVNLDKAGSRFSIALGSGLLEDTLTLKLLHQLNNNEHRDPSEDLPESLQAFLQNENVHRLLGYVSDLREFANGALDIMTQDLRASLPKEVLHSINKNVSPELFEVLAQDITAIYQENFFKQFPEFRSTLALNPNRKAREINIGAGEPVVNMELMLALTSIPQNTATVTSVATGGDGGSGGRGGDTTDVLTATNINTDESVNVFVNTAPVAVNGNVNVSQIDPFRGSKQQLLRAISGRDMDWNEAEDTNRIKEKNADIPLLILLVRSFKKEPLENNPHFHDSVKKLLETDIARELISSIAEIRIFMDEVLSVMRQELGEELSQGIIAAIQDQFRPSLMKTMIKDIRKTLADDLLRKKTMSFNQTHFGIFDIPRMKEGKDITTEYSIKDLLVLTPVLADYVGDFREFIQGTLFLMKQELLTRVSPELISSLEEELSPFIMGSATRNLIDRLVDASFMSEESRTSQYRSIANLLPFAYAKRDLEFPAENQAREDIEISELLELIADLSFTIPASVIAEADKSAMGEDAGLGSQGSASRNDISANNNNQDALTNSMTNANPISISVSVDTSDPNLLPGAQGKSPSPSWRYNMVFWLPQVAFGIIYVFAVMPLWLVIASTGTLGILKREDEKSGDFMSRIFKSFNTKEEETQNQGHSKRKKLIRSRPRGRRIINTTRRIDGKKNVNFRKQGSPKAAGERYRHAYDVANLAGLFEHQKERAGELKKREERWLEKVDVSASAKCNTPYGGVYGACEQRGKSPLISPVTEFHSMMHFTVSSIKVGPLRSYMISCKIPDSLSNGTVPTGVSIMSSPCGTVNNFLPVSDNRMTPNEERKDFAVCVKNLDFPQRDMTYRLVEWIEMLRILGADKVFMYNVEVHSNNSLLLRHYVKEGYVDLTPITLPVTLDFYYERLAIVPSRNLTLGTELKEEGGMSSLSTASERAIPVLNVSATSSNRPQTDNPGETFTFSTSPGVTIPLLLLMPIIVLAAACAISWYTVYDSNIPVPSKLTSEVFRDYNFRQKKRRLYPGQHRSFSALLISTPYTVFTTTPLKLQSPGKHCAAKSPLVTPPGRSQGPLSF
ncbi:unnamed protein product [Cyprideis torosa]|uniref:Uncharacterized protein n=1 Tax=Cyprideis torosa TaxID=163714 RepID=A0A7R8WEF1_9CRUS|nr:unnamed protein product [Cyprideis torosa]CAG0889726.1 unnamed protein product [Cyprideis torosa]